MGGVLKQWRVQHECCSNGGCWSNGGYGMIAATTQPQAWLLQQWRVQHGCWSNGEYGKVAGAMEGMTWLLQQWRVLH